MSERGVELFKLVRDLLYQNGWYIEESTRDIDDLELRITARPWAPEPGQGHEDPA